jgi:hypothetical protein
MADYDIPDDLLDAQRADMALKRAARSAPAE